MFKRRGMWRWAAIAAVVALMATGCGGLPDNTKQPAEALKGQIASTQQSIDNDEKAFSQRLTQPDASFMAGYADQVKGEGFTKAHRAQAEAAKLYNDQLAPLLKTNDKKDAGKVNDLVKQINDQLALAQRQSKEPAGRIDAVIQTKANAESVSKEASGLVTAIEQRDDGLMKAAGQATAKHPDSKSSIDKHLSEAHGWRTSSDSALKAMTSTLASSTPNYATVLDSLTTIRSAAQSSVAKTPALSKAVADLDTSAVETLTDLKITCTIKVSRTSWDENSDYDKEANFTFPDVNSDNAELCVYWADVDEHIAGDAKIAHTDVGGMGFKRGKFNVEKGIDRSMWDRLGLDSNQGWPSDDNKAEFYLEDVEAKYYVKKTTSINGVPTEGDWQEVDSDEFADLQDSLGMDIYQRKAGQFEDEANYQPSPPGSAYVGDSHYGHWQNDSSGNSFWAFYGQYRFFSDLLGGPFYRSDYDRWNSTYRYHQPYYGDTGGHPRWGTKASSTAARFPNSNYVRTGGPKAKATVRGAGPAGRGRGPGGGGK